MCMLDGKTVFTVPNLSENAVLVRFDVLFADIFDVVTGCKGRVQLNMGTAKNQTITIYTCPDNSYIYILYINMWEPVIVWSLAVPILSCTMPLQPVTALLYIYILSDNYYIFFYICTQSFFAGFEVS